MTAQFHTHMVGDIECTVIADGEQVFGLDRMQGRYPDVPQDALLRALQAADIPPDEITFHFNTLLIRTGDELLLVDAGSGTEQGDEVGKLLGNLAAAGVQPDEITTVLITHMHGDHIGGVFTPEVEFTFPNARYFVGQQEWRYWADKELLQSMGDFGKMIFERMKKLEPEVKKFTPGTQLSPGVRTVAAYGHTPGHTGVMVESQGERLLHAVDILHNPVQFAHPEWSIKFDTDKTLAQETRFRLLERAANEDLLLLLYHVPFPGLGRVALTRDGDREYFVWTPLAQG